MTREGILSTLREDADELKRLGAARLFLFGSVARDEAGPGSDVDLFLDFENPKFSLVELVALQRRISGLLKRPADLMTRNSIHSRLRAGIESTAIQVF